MPLARGGTNHIDNIVPACPICNRRKGTLTDQEYFKLLADEREYATRRRGWVGEPDTGSDPVNAGTSQSLNRPEQTTTAGMKRCSTCRQFLPLESFGKHRGKPDDLAARCKTCAAAGSVAWRRANVEKDRATRRQQNEAKRADIKAQNLAYPPILREKQCRKCREVRPATDFHRDIYSLDGLQRHCKECRRSYHRDREETLG